MITSPLTAAIAEHIFPCKYLKMIYQILHHQDSLFWVSRTRAPYLKLFSFSNSGPLKHFCFFPNSSYIFSISFISETLWDSPSSSSLTCNDEQKPVGGVWTCTCACWRGEGGSYPLWLVTCHISWVFSLEENMLNIQFLHLFLFHSPWRLNDIWVEHEHSGLHFFLLTCL